MLKSYLKRCLATLTFLTLSSTTFAIGKMIDGHDISITAAQIANIGNIEIEAGIENRRLNVQINNRRLTLLLKPNEPLLGGNRTFLNKHEIELYRGEIQNVSNSWVRISVTNSVFSGVVYDGESLILLEPFSKAKKELDAKILHNLDSQLSALASTNATLAIKIEDIKHNSSCALHADHLDAKGYEFESFINELSAQTSNPIQSNQQTATRSIPISLFADTEFSSSSATATADMLTHLNFADGIFAEQLDIQFVLEEAVELSDNDTLTSNVPIDLLTAFRVSGLPNPGLRHLFTGKDLQGSTVGIAYVGTLCRSSSAGLTQRFGSLTGLIFTHELGHNFGSPHDNQSGSACASTSSGYVMNPSVNSGGPTFSACSIEQIQPVIDFTASRSNTCITEVTLPTIEITSTPQTVAKVGEAYQYDDDSKLDVVGNGPLTFTLDIAPDSMTIEDIGLITWTPNSDQIGSNFVQITVSNQYTSAVHIFEVIVEDIIEEDPIEYFDFSTASIQSFSSSQDRSGEAIVGTDNNAIELIGNSWKRIDFDYQITTNTVLEFEFESNIEGELHGIAFDTDSGISANQSFIVHGSQNWGINFKSYDEGSGKMKFSIPIGRYYTGNFDRLVLINDNDANKAGVNSIFSNLRVYEDESDDPNQTVPEATPLDFNTLSLTPFQSGIQDVDGSVSVIESGLGIELVGNKWQSVIIDNVPITPRTVISLEFKTDSTGEIHGVGFFNGGIDENRMFQFHGTQNWGIKNTSYTGQGDYQYFEIPVGRYLTMQNASLTFVMDNDVSNSTANSSFRNVRIFER